MSLIRRFSKRVLGAGIVRRVKGERYHTRTQSRYKKRVSALRRVQKKELQSDMERQGLIEEKTTRGPRR